MATRAQPLPKVEYHHGSLRRALLDAALLLFAERGGFEFTLRELARAAGVTHNAPYRHFANKAELLSALREEGLERLAQASSEALARAPKNPRQRVRALGESYVRFAMDHPLQFRLVLSHPLETTEPGTDHENGSYALLETTLKEAQTVGAVRRDLSARELALAAWALVHGLASLLSSGRLPAGATRLRAYTELLSTIFFDGAGVPITKAKRATRAKPSPPRARR